MIENEQLPEGLQLAIHIAQQECLMNTTIGAPEAWNEELLTAIDAIRDEHRQRVTLQHHAADQAHRIDQLEAKVDTLKRLHDAVTSERDELNDARDYWDHLGDYLQELYNDGKLQEDYTAQAVVGYLRAMEKERDELRAKLAEINGQESVCRIHPDGTIELNPAGIMPDDGELYARPVPAIPDGRKLVPVEPNQAMRDVMDGEGWQWADLLAAAEVVTETEYIELAPPRGVADISDRLVAISEAIANSDDRKAQGLLRETLKLLAAAPGAAR